MGEAAGNNSPTVVAVVALALFYGFVLALRWVQPRLAQTAVGPRIARYLAICANQWALSGLVLVVLWALAERAHMNLSTALADIGLHLQLAPDDVAIWTMGMISAAFIVSTAIIQLRGTFGGMPTKTGVDILPTTPAETAVFSLIVSPTAGFNEEFVYRGFLTSQLWGFTNDGWLAALLVSAIFGLIHLYQGWWGVLRTGAIGFVFAVGVVMTGSLIPSMIAHALVNMMGVTVRVSERLRELGSEPVTK